MPRASPQGASKVPSNNNPRGINQYKDCPAPDDPRISELLRGYQRKGITDRKKISKLLREEHEIIMSDTTVSRRRRELGLKASGKTTADLPDDVKRQLVLDQMAKDAAGKMGVKTVKTRIFEETGIDLTRGWIRKEMQTLAPKAYEARKPRRRGALPTEHRLSSNSFAKRGLVSEEIRLLTGPEPHTNEDFLFVEDTGIIQDNLHHNHVEVELHHPIDFSSSRENSPTNDMHRFAAPGVLSALPTQLQVMVAETEAKMTDLTRYLRSLSPTSSSLNATVSQSLLTCMESATLLEREITRVIST